MNRDHIIIKDWAGNILFKGHYEDPAVNEVLEANRCKEPTCLADRISGVPCDECNSTGYSGDFEVFWVDEDRADNVYEFINY